MRRYAACADSFLRESHEVPAGEAEAELFAIKTALYARALTLFDTTRLLLEDDRQLDGRIQARGVIETVM